MEALESVVTYQAAVTNGRSYLAGQDAPGRTTISPRQGSVV